MHGWSKLYIFLMLSVSICYIPSPLPGYDQFNLPNGPQEIQ